VRLITLAAVLTLAACGQPPAESSAPPAPEAATPEAAAPSTSASIEGWDTATSAYAKIGTTLPAFTARKEDGSEITAEALRGRWTILGLWGPTSIANETSFASALNSAVDQDPDLDLLIEHTLVDGTPSPDGPWPKLSDTGLAAMLGPPVLPSYLLIGPDLTIEGWRGPLELSPENGIKPVIQGVHEIRKQVSAPH
jgi:hypothetical protein